MEDSENMAVWNKVKTPPKEALKKITGGRLSGMTDISPQWRYEIMTQVFGPCGVGWRYNIEKMWTAEGVDGQIFQFVQINLYVMESIPNDDCTHKEVCLVNTTWSDPIPGVGGSMLIVKENKGLHCNDEAVKMALTDALSVAMKQLGVGADVYAGKTDSSKYNKIESQKNEKKKEKTWEESLGEAKKALGEELYDEVVCTFLFDNQYDCLDVVEKEEHKIELLKELREAYAKKEKKHADKK